MNRNDGAVGDARKRLDESVARLEQRDVVAEAYRIERLAAVMYGNPDAWCRGTGMNRSYWRRMAARQIGSEATR